MINMSSKYLIRDLAPLDQTATDPPPAEVLTQVLYAAVLLEVVGLVSMS